MAKKKLKILNVLKKKKKQYRSKKKEYEKELKYDKKFILTLGIIGLAVLIIGTILFGFLVALLLTFMYAVLMLLTQVLDNTRKSSKLRKFVKLILSFGLILAVIGLMVIVAFLIYVVITSPDFDVDKLKYRELSELYDNKGKTIATLGLENRDNITYEDLPEVFIDAVVATEDSRFFQHNGLDAPRFVKAVVGQLFRVSDAGGGSTLTMQVSKNNFTSRNASGIKGIARKFTDIYVSIFKIEKAYSKEQIIEFYVNEPYLGSNSYGVEQAAKTYFNKSISEINLSEASLIAGLFQAPSNYDPLANPENAAERRSTVLSLMVKHGYITKEEKEIAESIPVEDLLKSSSYAASPYQGYIDTVISEIVDKTGMDPYVVPMKIYTNMDTDKQANLNKVFNGETYKWPDNDIQAGVMAIDVSNGKIIAVGAGRNRVGARTYNFATDIKRQIGSTAKPIFDYGPAIEYENWSTGQTILDNRYSYSGGGVISNYDGRYLGNITLRYALSDSRNVPALKAFQAVENSKIKKFVTTLGMTPEIDSDGMIHEAHSLGAFDGTSPLQLAGAYQAFANGGYYYEPYSVSKIILKDTDETLEFKSDKVKAMSDSTAYMITDVLKMVASSIGVRNVVNSEVATKTGTTNYSADVARMYGYPYNATPDGLIAGYTPKIAMAMWTGYKENVKGRYLVQNSMVNHRNALYRACAKAVFDNDGARFNKPASVVQVTVEKGTDPLALAGPYTPYSLKITELFKKGTEPTEIATTYQKLDNVTGLEANYSSGKVKLTWNSVNPLSGYKEEKDGILEYEVYLDGQLIGTTENNFFIHTTTDPYGTYKVRTIYSKRSGNNSDGTTVSIEPDITFTYNGSESETIPLGSSWSPSDNPYTVTMDGEDVTSKANIDITITKNGQVVSSVDTSVVGDVYEVKYTVSYKGKSKSNTCTVTIE